jgi:hypothetical protein
MEVKSMNRIMLLGLILLTLYGCKTMEQMYVEDGYRELKGEELKAKVSGSTVNAGRWQDTYAADGKMSGTSFGGSGDYSGTWQIDSTGKLCIECANQYVNGCAKVFIKDSSGSIEWIEADGKAYSVKIAPAKK